MQEGTNIPVAGSEQLMSKKHRRDMQLLNILQQYDHSDPVELSTILLLWQGAADKTTRNATGDDISEPYDLRSISVPWTVPSETALNPEEVLSPSMDLYENSVTDDEDPMVLEDDLNSGGEDEEVTENEEEDGN
ncbi:hypothetical protein BJ508DRAFT_329676 [Ascobolus immersus RN42]|uniref:Uncharacterized protein n=1 Tax=Ascobolus immersus RN42 TaxID=1160509 RepID=A0A3N4I1P7_ASCIM|nr:hypothetical protein BJ508DRAFT_329676 [Ascobolus immersus RN42]